MRRDGMCLVLVGVLGLVGCGDSGSDSGVQANEPAADQATEPKVVSPLELMKQREKDASSEAVKAEALEAEAEAVKAEAKTPAEIQTPAANAIHRIAGRSAFPEQGEAIDALIPAKKLSEEDPFASPIDEVDIPDVVPWTEAKRYLGHEITVQGKIVDVGSVNEGSVNFLNFHKDWQGKFYMVVFDDLAKTMPKTVYQTFYGKTVRVTGEVEDHRGRPQIKILSMDQVQFVGE